MGFSDKRVELVVPSGLADALFSKTQQRVLAFLFGQPERSFFSNELIQLTGGGAGAIQRELKKLFDSGLVTVNRVGNQKHYQANPSSPVFEELCSISKKTFGLALPLQVALKPVENDIQVAFIYGSVARGKDHALSDVDIMIISNAVDYADIFGLLEPVSQLIDRTINPTIMTESVFVEKRSSSNPFLSKVLERDRFFIIGNENDIPA